MPQAKRRIHKKRKFTEVEARLQECFPDQLKSTCESNGFKWMTLARWKPEPPLRTPTTRCWDVVQCQLVSELSNWVVLCWITACKKEMHTLKWPMHAKCVMNKTCLQQIFVVSVWFQAVLGVRLGIEKHGMSTRSRSNSLSPKSSPKEWKLLQDPWACCWVVWSDSVYHNWTKQVPSCVVNKPIRTPPGSTSRRLRRPSKNSSQLRVLLITVFNCLPCDIGSSPFWELGSV